jgi:glutamine amidotransferase
MITIVDYDMGNVGSIKNILHHLGYYDVQITSDREKILNSSHVILPGVGSFDEGMKNLEAKNLDLVLKEYVSLLKKPLLGICLGMQLLGNSSEEGIKKGLGLINFNNVKFTFDNGLKTPHMGWNYVRIYNKNNTLLKDLDNTYRFYFVHSYHPVCHDESNILLTAKYGYEFTVAVSHQNLYGVQFHPEKSHSFGMKLFQNFLGIV